MESASPPRGRHHSRPLLRPGGLGHDRFAGNNCKGGQNSTHADRFIPVRSAMDMDVAHFLLTTSSKQHNRAGDNAAAELLSPSRQAYRKLLAECCLGNRTRILAFNDNKKSDPTLSDRFLNTTESLVSCRPTKPVKQRRYIRQTPERTLDAPDLVDDFYLNLLDWGSKNVLAIALGHTAYLWDASDKFTAELTTVDESEGPVTSVSWAPDGIHLAVGLWNSDVQLWDASSCRMRRTLRGTHQSRVGALSWTGHILTSGGMDGSIVNSDVRVRSHVVQTYDGHRQEVCGLKWAESGEQLASGGNDDLVHIWDASMSSSHGTQWLHRLDSHRAAVKALAWCPFQRNLLASGGGGNDQCIKFWNTDTGACLNSEDTGSQICGLLWSKHERELLSSHGYEQNQLTLWKYPSMVKMTELKGHASRVLFMAHSPDGATVASAAADETLRFWNVFGDPGTQKPAARAGREVPLAHLCYIR